jgi:hypothetical protein
MGIMGIRVIMGIRGMREVRERRQEKHVMFNEQMEQSVGKADHGEGHPLHRQTFIKHLSNIDQTVIWIRRKLESGRFDALFKTN